MTGGKAGYVQLLGAARVRVGFEWISFIPDKRHQLLAYLAYRSDWVSRDWDIAASFNNLGITASEQSDYTRGRLLLEESLAIRRKLEDKRGITYVLGSLGNVAFVQGDY